MVKMYKVGQQNTEPGTIGCVDPKEGCHRDDIALADLKAVVMDISDGHTTPKEWTKWLVSRGQILELHHMVQGSNHSCNISFTDSITGRGAIPTAM